MLTSHYAHIVETDWNTLINSFGGESELIKCAKCNGSGKVNTGSLFGAWYKTCPVCDGTGVNRV